VTLFGLMAELERDLISMRTREALAAKKAQGKILGRPKGSLGKSKLDGKEDEISRLLESKVSKAAIARITGVSWLTLDRFIKSRGLSSS
jgi:DNA invertase Pin-like site-specific DNA recombinase